MDRKQVALNLKNHIDGLLSYFRHRVTNANAEGFNSRIQSIKSAARGFRSFKNYRLRILSYCGKLYLTPQLCHLIPGRTKAKEKAKTIVNDKTKKVAFTEKSLFLLGIITAG